MDETYDEEAVSVMMDSPVVGEGYRLVSREKKERHPLGEKIQRAAEVEVREKERRMALIKHRRGIQNQTVPHVFSSSPRVIIPKIR